MNFLHLLVEGIDLNCQSNCGWTALHLAVKLNKPGCVQLLREAPGLEFNLRDDDGLTPLITAASSSRADILQILLSVPQPQLDITATDDDGDNVAWCAVLGEEEERDYLRCVELLCEDPRVDWNTRDPRDGETPLLYCLEEGEVEMAKMIIKNPRVDLNAQNNNGKFPETIAR